MTVSVMQIVAWYTRHYIVIVDQAKYNVMYGCY